MAFLIICLLAFGTWALWTAISFSRNYRQAPMTKLPIIISPVSFINPYWIIVTRLFPSIIPVVHNLPLGIGRWAKYSYMGWQFDDKHAVHSRLGPAFVFVNPVLGTNEVHLADPAAVHRVLNKRKEFIKPAMMYDALNIFGLNVDSAEGEKWSRHRKITAPSFNERVSSTVWKESVRQAQQMLGHWMHTPEGTRELVDDTASLTLNVFTYAGFGLQYVFNEASGRVPSPHHLSYRDALHRVLQNFMLLVILPMAWLKLPVMPSSIQKVGRACDEFKLYMKEMVDREKLGKSVSTAEDIDQDRDTHPHNLLQALTRASQAQQAGAGLKDEELYGNLFIYAMAGHETTANTLATAIAFLAAAPKWQDWLYDELRSLDPLENDSSSQAQIWEYEAVFPRLTRCQAVMLETLRLHGSVVFIPKTTTNLVQTVTIAGSDHVIPPNTFVIVNSQALHTDPNIWGEDALVWRPDRWIADTSGQTGTSRGEELVEPSPGTFVAWAEGPRVCPGQKFSQVEFAAVVAVLFRDHKVRFETEGKEIDAKRYLESILEDSGLMSFTLQMRRPKDIRLIWQSRD